MKQLVPVLVSVQYNKLSWCAEKDLDMSLKHHQNEAEPNLPSVLRHTLTIIAVVVKKPAQNNLRNSRES